MKDQIEQFGFWYRAEWVERNSDLRFSLEQHFVSEKELMVVIRAVAWHHLTWTSVTKLNDFRLDKDF